MTLWKNIVANDLQRVIHEHGSPITYYTRNVSTSTDDYGQEIASYSGYSITAWVKLGGDELAKVIEPGIIPVQGIDVYISALDINFTPEILDRIFYDGATYEVRFVIPRLIEDIVVFWKIQARLVTPR